jgi:hypothetical protein
MFAHFFVTGNPPFPPTNSTEVMNRPIKQVAASGDKENNESSVALILKVTRAIC